MEKSIGLDLGSNSIGWAIRNVNLPDNQIEKYGVITFKTGVGKEKGVEYSFAARRTAKRSIRRLYQARKYRLWSTLEVLINNKMCPLTIEELDLWRKHIKGKTRQYPIIEKFENWIKLDFNEDGIPNYISPYQLRKEIATVQLDFNIEIDRFKLGRALYHIAQRRGFKSSKGETAKEQLEEINQIDLDDVNAVEQESISLKKSEQKKATRISEYIEQRKSEGIELPTIGCAFADIEYQGMRVRENWLQYTIRQQYEDEIQYIFKFQKDLDIQSEFYKSLHKAIFYKRPLRSQKGLVGKCTLEPQKSRCPISHPDFESFRAWSFINNIRIKRERTVQVEDWQELSMEIKQLVFDKVFMKVRKNFNFSEIADFITKELNTTLSFNYKFKTNISGCPVSARLRNLLGSNWREWTLNETTFNWEDIWHIWFSFEDEEYVEEYSKNKLNFEPSQVKQFMTGWAGLPVGYAMLSVKAIRNINPFLEEGLIYTDAVLLAKMPEILGNKIWIENKQLLIDEVKNAIAENRKNKTIYNIVNTLISKYKSLEYNEKFAHKNTQYKLDDLDKKEIEKTIIEAFGKKKFSELSESEQSNIRNEVSRLYQGFFETSHRDYYKLPRIVDILISFILDNFPQITEKQAKKLYHPSMIEFYTQVKDTEYFDGINAYQLPSPKVGSFKNPMAMRTLFELRKLLNYLLKKGEINEETRIVVEVARELNDANKRWAIEAYQRQREAENKEFEAVIIELLKDPEFKGVVNSNNDTDIDKLRIFSEQIDISETYIPQKESENKKIKKAEKIEQYYYKSPEFIQKVIAAKDLKTKYRLWKEQQFCCIYTGKFITITDLFNDNVIDFEHTIPRSISFDNSLANLTVCYADFNRNVKRKRIPSQLDNYEDILNRIGSWKEKVERLKDNVEFWKKKSKGAATKDFKDKAIRQRHLWQMELDYWQNKVSRFEMKEVTTSFKNSQLVDTQLISKYAYHFLKSVFQKVDVQKGNTTAEFRKIYEIQEKGSKKDRSKHSHHAKDAAVLTLIPVAAKRDEILKNAFEYEEIRKQQYHENPYLGFIREHIESIDETILINNISRDQALSIGKKLVRKRGKIVPLVDSDRNFLYEKDENGNMIYRKHKDGNLLYKKDHNGNFILDQIGEKIPIPKLKPKLSQGDCIRGQLHQETFLGANRIPKIDENGKWQKNENGNIIFEKDLLFVKREPFVFKANAQSPGFSSLDDIKTKIVDKALYSFIEKQVNNALQNGKIFKDIMVDGIWHKGPNGKLTRIRHLRVKTSAKEPLKIKRQSHISGRQSKFLADTEHKQYYYVANGENYCFALYQGIVKNKIERAFKLYGLFDVAGIYSIDKKLDIPLTKEIKKDVFIPLHAILRYGQKVLFYRDNEENPEELEPKELSKRLYKIFSFEQESEGKARIALQHHLDSSVPTKTGEEVSAEVNFEKPFKFLRISKNNFNFLIEGKDFICEPDGTIKFK